MVGGVYREVQLLVSVGICSYFVGYIGALVMLTGFAAGVSSAVIVEWALNKGKMVDYIVPVVIDVAALSFFFPVLRLFVYHLAIIH